MIRSPSAELFRNTGNPHLFGQVLSHVSELFSGQIICTCKYSVRDVHYRKCLTPLSAFKEQVFVPAKDRNASSLWPDLDVEAQVQKRIPRHVHMALKGCSF